MALDTAHCWVDAWAFEQALPACPRRSADAVDGALAAAQALYHGPLFGDAELPQVFEARNRLLRALIVATASCGDTRTATGAYERCQSFLMTRFGMLPTVATERAWRESRGLHAGPRSLAYAAAGLPGD